VLSGQARPLPKYNIGESVIINNNYHTESLRGKICKIIKRTWYNHPSIKTWKYVLSVHLLVYGDYKFQIFESYLDPIQSNLNSENEEEHYRLSDL
jgi:hypothetical protein